MLKGNWKVVEEIIESERKSRPSDVQSNHSGATDLLSQCEVLFISVLKMILILNLLITALFLYMEMLKPHYEETFVMKCELNY